MNYREYIVRDPKVLDGVPILKGTQIPLKVVIGHLALGDSVENIVKTYPVLTPEAVRAVIAFTAALAEVELVANPGWKRTDGFPGGLLSDKNMASLLEALGPETNAYLLSLADIYLRQGFLDAARKIYEQILEKEPGNVEVQNKLDGLKNLLKPNN